MQCNVCGGFHHKRVDIKAGEFGTARMPYSEICMSMRVAGKWMHFQVVMEGKYLMVQLIEHHKEVPILKSRMFSFPILLGEAGIYTDEKGNMYYYKELEHEEFVELEKEKAQCQIVQ